ncbi:MULTISPECIES: hypothetical protein [Methanobacterium]|uniref:Uncharacterized protein n=1 Tax=Methanobacterium veterum TaxID=408577 RepID=A0A9E5DLV7_9EURY|nr:MULTISPECIES: hypothetical protein [Methanobacterium]MCZ3367079.1 hypothetical protein [Methanobacterium veterum]MCZ3373774.1 hypothetical protein [Methanobacterium veterum]
MALKKLPEIDENVKNQFTNAVKNHYGGIKWRVLRQETQNALTYYVEVGPLSEDLYIENETTGDVEKIKLTIPAFLKNFDNQNVYLFDKIDTEYLKNVVAKITGKDSEYNWRKWSKIIKQSGRIKQMKGTRHYRINRKRFKFISNDLKEFYDLQIQERQQYSYENVKEDTANRIYKKLAIGQTTKLIEICKLGKISEKEGKKVIDKLENQSKLQLVSRGIWKVLDPAAARVVNENSLIEGGMLKCH